MTRQSKIRLLIAVGAVALASAGTGQQATSPSAIDPEAIGALDKMSAALSGLSTIAFDADVTQEQVLTNGQKLQFGGRLEVVADRPNRLYIDAQSDRQNRRYYFDGQTLSIVAPKLGYYTQVPLQGSIATLVAKAEEEYDVNLPLADLFAWDSNPDLRSRIKSGYVIRPETVGGKTCTHYAFRQQNVDWQIWIADGDAALPCKLVITDTSDAARPQYSAIFDWKNGSIRPDQFTFSPSGDMKHISIAKVREAAAAGGGQ